MTEDTTTTLSRRALLRRIGLAAGAAYVAPAMLGLNAAQADAKSARSARSTRRRRTTRPKSARPKSIRRKVTRPKAARSKPSRRSRRSR